MSRKPIDEKYRCTAHTSKGTSCKKARLKGTTVCKTHGGGAPQVVAAARRRLQMAADRAAGVLEDIMAATDEGTPAAARVRAAEAILDRAGLPRKQTIEHEGAEGLVVVKVDVASMQSRAEPVDGPEEEDDGD